MKILTKESFDKLLSDNNISAYRNNGKCNYKGVYCTECELLTNVSVDKIVYVVM